MAEIAKPNFHAGAEVIRAQAAKIEEQAAALTAAEARIKMLEAQIERVRNEATRCLSKMEMVGPNWLLEALTGASDAG